MENIQAEKLKTIETEKNELKMKLQYSEKEKLLFEKEKEMFKKLEYEKDEIIKEKTQLLNTFIINSVKTISLNLYKLNDIKIN